MDEILGLPADVGTAITLIVTGVLVPVVTSVLKRPELSSTWKRVIPIGLAALAGVFIVWLQAGGPFVEQVFTWLVVAATVVGIAQAVYTAMPGAWKRLETATSPKSPANGEWSAFPGDTTHNPSLSPTVTDLSPQRGVEQSDASIEKPGADTAPYRERPLNQPPEDDYTQR